VGRPKVRILRRSAMATAVTIGLLTSGGAGLAASDVVALRDDVTAISAGGYHGCALKGDGTVWCWGDDTYGQLGDGTTGDADHHRLKAVRVRRGSGHLSGVSAISGGERHTCARRGDGSAWCWGDDTYGQLGDGTTGDAHHLRLRAVRVRQGGGSLTGVAAVSAGRDHTCARKADGSAWCWGYGEFGQLGDGTTGDADHLRQKAVRVTQGGGFLADVRRLDAGRDHTCVRRGDGTAWCWGAGGDGSLGDGTTGDANGVRLKAVRVVRATGDLTDVRDISAGAEHSCAARANGTAWCWGMDNSAQLGDGLYDGVPHPYAKRVVLS
jgi:alpha-tubulin suppressor-like RCC1 family protein